MKIVQARNRGKIKNITCTALIGAVLKIIETTAEVLNVFCEKINICHNQNEKTTNNWPSDGNSDIGN